MNSERSVPLGNLVGTRFERLLMTVEQQLKLSLEQARITTSHPGDKGGNVEGSVRDVLREYVPASYGVGYGKVYDAFEDESAQADVVITNADHPFRYPLDKAGAFLMEGVGAVGEVKSVLTTSELDRCIAAGTRFKRLRPTYQVSDFVIGSEDSKEYFEETGGMPPFFVLAFENTISLKTLWKRLHEAEPVECPEGKGFDTPKGNNPQPPIDAVCVLGEAVYWNTRATGPIKFNVEGNRVSGWVAIETAAPLAWTLAWLHTVMPRMQRQSSVVGPYFTPATRHRNYIANRNRTV